MASLPFTTKNIELVIEDNWGLFTRCINYHKINWGQIIFFTFQKHSAMTKMSLQEKKFKLSSNDFFVFQ
jgi:hypothetical protein